MNFYVIESSVEKVPFETEFFYLKPHRNGDAPRCPVCGDYIGSLTSLPPYNIELELWDRGFGDISFGPGDNLLVSGRFKALWHEQELTGLDGFHPVEIVKVKRHERFQGDPPNYYLAEICRSEATIDQTASGFEWEKPPTCDLCKEGSIKRWKKHLIVSNTWKGENIFRPRGLSGSIMTDQRFKEFVEQFRITNCYLISAEEYSYDFYPCKNDSRG